MSKRLILIDVMQGIAMFLVVLGHHRFSFMPKWYEHMFNWIYTFHMPLFIFISGFLMRYSYKGINSWAEYKPYIIKRIKKFVPSFLIVGAICTLMTWDFNDINALLTKLSYLFIAPRYSEVTFLWYIYTLFVFYCISPFIFNAKPWIKCIILILALYSSIQIIPVRLFNIDYISRYFIFFLAGAFVAKNYSRIKQYKKVITSTYTIILIVFVIMSIIFFTNDFNATQKYVMQWLGIPAFICIAQLFKQWNNINKMFVWISVNCFGIYLLHMFFIQAGAMIVGRLPFSTPSWGYIAYLLVSTAISIYASALLWKNVCKITIKKQQ